MNDMNRNSSDAHREDDIEAPIQGLSRLPMHIAPQRDLWPGIDSRIRARRRSPMLWSAAAGVAVVAVLAAGAVADRHRALLGGETVAYESSAVSVEAPAELAAATRPQRSAMLMPVVSQPLHPETRALVRANLKIVSKAESQVQRALREDPDDAYLHRLLATTRQQKAALRVALAENDR